MRYSIFCIIFVLLLANISCTPYPRYRSGGGVAPELPDEPVKVGLDTNQRLILGAILQRYLGRPYAGRSQYEQGVDCSYFVRDVVKKFNGDILPRTAAEQFKAGEKVPHKRLLFGDLVFFRTEKRAKITHVGVYLGDSEFIHASSSRGVIISSLGEKYWAERYAGGRRVLKRSSE